MFNKHLVITLASTLALLSPSLSRAQAPKPTPAQTNEDKLDVSGLEKKYWAAKDTDFNVVQNRLYSKAGRFALTGNYGTMINDTWSDGPTFGGSLAYYFSERYGIEAHYTNTDSTDNDATKQLRGQFGIPDHNKMTSFYGASFNWVPFYAKVSVLNSAIIYFDMSFSLGGGVTTYEQQTVDGNIEKTAPTVTFDVSQHYFLSRYLALRVDYKNRWYNEEIVKARSGSSGIPTGTKIKDDLTNASLLMFGVTLYY